MSIIPTLSQSTWQTLGLTVGIGYAGLGLTAIFAPVMTSGVFGLPLGTGPIDRDPVARSFKLVGVRDLTFAAVLIYLHAQNQPQAMGAIITCGNIIAAWDTYECVRNNKIAEAALSGAIASFWAVIGLRLLG